ncbi:hypothetical protein [Nannocystis punicea]|uniref:Uncharacterized protein n=1 Tax=Nannocystis punicea TaxID=2995304 RepID=A0ABY7HDV8_9BACT|nr:hypothetical protein [Nannocystis poenicansa]WAS97219.1 hypothetical protein O0S08_13815 [Nannocystis poenicansa]
MTRGERIHYSARDAAPGARQRGLCGQRVPAEQLASAMTAINCERCRAILSSPARADEIAAQLLAVSSGDLAGAWRALAVWIEDGTLLGGPEHLRRLLAAVRVELDRRGATSPPVPETSS